MEIVLSSKRSTGGIGKWSSDGIQRIVENLCINAIHYGEPDGKVTIKLVTQPGSVQLSVHNFGKPIPPEERETLFEYFRDKSSSDRAVGHKGWGVGLAVVDGIVDAHKERSGRK